MGQPSLKSNKRALRRTAREEKNNRGQTLRRLPKNQKSPGRGQTARIAEGIMETRGNEEYHALIEDLTEHKFFGEVTFYFQGGNIESSRKSEHNTKNEVKKMMEGRKSNRHRVLVPRPASAEGKANG